MQSARASFFHCQATVGQCFLEQVCFLAVSNETVTAGAFQTVTWRCFKMASLSRLPYARCLARPDACPRACVRGKGVGKAGRSAPPEFLIQRKR